MKKRVLLLDTSFSAKPIYDFLVKTGNEVFVVGGNPEDALAKSVKNYVRLNYANINEVKSLIKDLDIDFLVPGGNDFSYKVCSNISADISFYNIDSVGVEEIINNKEKYRKFSTELNLHVPRIVEYEQINDFLPVIVKPVDAYSGHGMSVIYEPNKIKIENAINHAKKFSKSQCYLIEEFVQGQLYSHSAFIVNGEIMIDFIVEEHCIVNPYVVDTSRVIFDFDKYILSQIHEDITKFAKKLKLPDGLIHTQLICNGDSFWLIETNRRCPGDLYSKLIELSTGFPYAEYYARPFIDDIKNIRDFKMNSNMIIRHTISLDKPASFNSISFNFPVNIFKYVPLSLTGDQIKESPISRIGLIFFHANSESEWNDLFQSILNRELYLIQ